MTGATCFWAGLLTTWAFVVLAAACIFYSGAPTFDPTEAERRDQRVGTLLVVVVAAMTLAVIAAVAACVLRVL